MTKWLTADHHFGHRNILEFTSRPWKTVDQMEVGLMEKWNERVKEEDEVYVIGDFSFNDRWETNRILRGLKGTKHLVMGNHDGTVGRNLGIEGWGSVNKMMEVDGVVLMHDALWWAARNGWQRGWPKMFCGHVHESWKVCWGRFVNVGVDQWGGAPVSWEEASKCFE